MKYIKVFNPTSKSFHVKNLEIKSNDSIMLAPYEGDKSLNFINALKRSGLTVSIVNLADTPANTAVKKAQFKIVDTTTNEKISTEKTETTKVSDEKETKITENTDTIQANETKVEAKTSDTKPKSTQQAKKEPETKQRKKPGPKPKAKTEENKKVEETKTKSEKSSSDKA